MKGIKYWNIVKLGDISQIVNGSTPSTSINDYWNGNITWVTPTDLGKLNNKEIYSSERKITQEGYNSANLTIIPSDSIVLSTRAPIGYIAITKDELCFNQGCKGIVPNENVFTDFLYYYLFFIRKSLEELGSGSTFKELSLTNLQKIDAPLPSLKEQKRIVKIIAEKLKSVEKAKIASEVQIVNISLLFSIKLKKYLNNKSWKKYKLIEVCKYFNDGDWIETEDQSTNGIRLIQTGNIGNGEYLDKPDVAKYISEDTFDRLHCSEVYPNDILISRLPKPVGRACIVPKLKTKMITAVDCTILRVNNQICDYRFLLYILMNDTYFNQVALLLAGSTRERISRSNLENINLFLPPLNEQFIIVNQLKKEYENIKYIKKLCIEQSLYINAFSQSILRQAFNGEL